MQSVEVKGLAELDYDLWKIFRELPEARRELHDRLADMLKKEVDEAIDSSGLNDSRGKIKNWQEPRVGSKGAYAAIRPLKGRGLVGNNSPGAITNYLENGHKTRESLADREERLEMQRKRRLEKQGRHKGRFLKKNTIVLDKRRWVPGYIFYGTASNSAEAKAISIAEEFVDEFIKKLEGK